MRLKLSYDEPPSSFAFKFNLRRYTAVPIFHESDEEEEDSD
jgi:hypothetical protein